MSAEFRIKLVHWPRYIHIPLGRRRMLVIAPCRLSGNGRYHRLRPCLWLRRQP